MLQPFFTLFIAYSFLLFLGVTASNDLGSFAPPGNLRELQNSFDLLGMQAIVNSSEYPIPEADNRLASCTATVSLCFPHIQISSIDRLQS